MKGRPRAIQQLYGAVGIMIVVALVYAVRGVLRYVPSAGVPVVSSQWERDGIAVELVGDRDHGGIYFLPRGATVSALFDEAGIHTAAGFNGADLAGALRSGDRVSFDTVRYRVTIGEMSASTRLALGMPIDLNTATLEELIIIPGIGRKTASKIVRFREKMGPFSEIETLKRIKGLGKKQYDKIKRHLFVDRPSSS